MQRANLKGSIVITSSPSLIIFIFESNPSGVEYHYTYGCYPFISDFLRILFGWIPFSIGDLIYFGIAIYILYIHSIALFGPSV